MSLVLILCCYWCCPCCSDSIPTAYTIGLLIRVGVFSVAFMSRIQSPLWLKLKHTMDEAEAHYDWSWITLGLKLKTLVEIKAHYGWNTWLKLKHTMVEAEAYCGWSWSILWLKLKHTMVEAEAHCGWSWSTLWLKLKHTCVRDKGTDANQWLIVFDWLRVRVI